MKRQLDDDGSADPSKRAAPADASGVPMGWPPGAGPNDGGGAMAAGNYCGGGAMMGGGGGAMMGGGMGGGCMGAMGGNGMGGGSMGLGTRRQHGASLRSNPYSGPAVLRPRLAALERTRVWPSSMPKLLIDLPADVVQHIVVGLTLAHHIARVAPTCHVVSVAVRNAFKVRPFTGEVVTLAGDDRMWSLAVAPDGCVVACLYTEAKVWRDGACERTIKPLTGTATWLAA